MTQFDRHGNATPTVQEAAGVSVPPLPSLPKPDQDSRLAAEVKALVLQGDLEGARARFDALVVRQQRRASRIAYHVLRDAADADEAVQDAFVKVFTHIQSFREDLPFEVWFTRILINGCLDRQKARRRRARWIVPSMDTGEGERDRIEGARASGASPEEALLLRERRVADRLRRGPPAGAPASDLPAVPLRGLLVRRKSAR